MAAQVIAGVSGLNINDEDDKSTEIWVYWITDEISIKGSHELGVEICRAFLSADSAQLTKLFSEANWDYKALFGEAPLKNITQAVEEASKSGALKGIGKSELLDLIKKTGLKGKKAVKSFFSTLASQNPSPRGKDDKRPKRGEHVINNNVLSVHKDIAEMFLARAGITNNGIGSLDRLDKKESGLIKDCSHYFGHRIREDIQNVLKVFLDENEVYIDANSVLYGNSNYILRELAVNHMMELYTTFVRGTANPGSRHSQPLRETVNQINTHLFYVDQHALMVWRRYFGARNEVTYERAQNAVEQMFRGLHDRVRDWVFELKRNGY